jgi:hypothetical protein
MVGRDSHYEFPIPVNVIAVTTVAMITAIVKSFVIIEAFLSILFMLLKTEDDIKLAITKQHRGNNED